MGKLEITQELVFQWLNFQALNVIWLQKSTKIKFHTQCYPSGILQGLRACPSQTS